MKNPYTQPPTYGYNNSDAIYKVPAPPVPPRGIPYEVKRGETVLTFVMLLTGLLYWEWHILSGASLGKWGFCFLILIMVTAFIYMTARKIKQNAVSLLWLAAAILGAVPFLLYESFDLRWFLAPFDFCLISLWISAATGTGLSQKLSGFAIGDLINQLFIIPFANFAGLFHGFGGMFKDRKHGKSVLAGFIGIIVAVPILVGVITLLNAADDSFGDIMHHIAKIFDPIAIGRYVWELIFGIPVACYLFGLIYGNTQRRHTSHITKAGGDRLLTAMHKLPRMSMYAPLIIFIAVYLIFLAALAPYLLSAFAGTLPQDFTYAEYARRGFFELCGVATINLILICITYIFIKRQTGEYPKATRIITGFIAGLTLLMIVIAASKMLLYIDAFGLTHLRIYTSWFMILLFVIFVIILMRQIRAFNAGKPIVIAVVVLTLALFLTNIDGLIENFNYQYLDSSSATNLTSLASGSASRISTGVGAYRV